MTTYYAYEHLSDLDLMWLVGLFEGEGCISTSKTQVVRLSMCSVDQDIMERLAYLTDSKVYGPSLPYKGAKQMIYRWQLARKDKVRSLLMAMRPHLGHRRTARLDEALVTMDRQLYPNGRGFGLKRPI